MKALTEKFIYLFSIDSSVSFEFCIVAYLNSVDLLWMSAVVEYFTELGYIGLFIASFLAATILPLGSEIVLVALIMSGLSPWGLLLIATLGNVLGSLTNYFLGYWASLSVIKKWLRMSESEFFRAERRFQKYGLLSMLFAWVPIIGDPLTVMAGILRIHLLWFLSLVTVGKLLRYIVIIYMAMRVN